MADRSFGVFSEWKRRPEGCAIGRQMSRAVGNPSRTKETSTTWQICLGLALFMINKSLLEGPTDTSHTFLSFKAVSTGNLDFDSIFLLLSGSF